MDTGPDRMAKRTLIRGALALCSIVAGWPCKSTSGASVVDLVNQVSVNSYTSYLQNDLYAHDGDERAWGPKHDLARQRIQERFEGFGLTTSLDPFVYQDTEYYNVVGVHPGVICPNEIYILGAHYDSVDGSPGAWDNASGVAVVLEAARILSQYAFEGTIIFIAFDREEQGLIGSWAYANEHTQDHIRGMISADGIAYEPYPPGNPNYGKVDLCYDWTRSTKLVYDLEGALMSYAGLTSVIGSLDPGYSSDYAPFESTGFAAALVISRAGSPFYHAPSDSVDTPAYIDYEYAAKVTRGVVGYLATQAKLASVRALPDFDGDGLVNLNDYALLAQHWGQSESRFDISPPPEGDGIVDAEDLAGLAYYWLNRWSNWWTESGLIAWWGLDEVEGPIAHDSAEHRLGTVHGDPLWQPTDGKINGALEFDGKGDYVSADLVLNPAGGPFSVFAWVKGGVGPGRVVISQQNGLDWLGTDLFGFGWLITNLKAPRGPSLFSRTVITDGDWHHVGFTWDGANRILYVDDVEVARDTQADLASSEGGLYIGAGSTLSPASCWKGLIDDVRIYDRAVQP